MRPDVGFDVGAVRSQGRDPRGIAAPIHAYAALSACGTAARPLVKTKGLFPEPPAAVATRPAHRSLTRRGLRFFSANFSNQPFRLNLMVIRQDTSGK